MDRYLRILLVEDDPIVLLTLTLELQAEGFEVLGVASAGEAQRALAAAPGALAGAVVDLDAPSGGDPFALVNLVRGLNAAAAVIYTAASLRPGSEAAGVGGDSVLIKPFPPRHLAQRVRAAVERGP